MPFWPARSPRCTASTRRKPGWPPGLGLSAHADRDGRGPGPAVGEAAGAVGSALAQVGDVAVGDGNESVEADAAIDMVAGSEIWPKASSTLASQAASWGV